MPLFVREVPGGFKTCDAKRCLSNKPMTRKQAEKQRIAVALSIHRSRGLPMKEIFGKARK